MFFCVKILRFAIQKQYFYDSHYIMLQNMYTTSGLLISIHGLISRQDVTLHDKYSHGASNELVDFVSCTRGGGYRDEMMKIFVRCHFILHYHAARNSSFQILYRERTFDLGSIST